MAKKEERIAFNFYKSYFTSLELLDDSEKLEFLLGLFNRQFFGVEPELSKLPQMVYMTQKHSVDKQVEGWESKTKTKLTPPVGSRVGPTQGSPVGSSEGGYEGKSKNPFLDIVMTTEGPCVGPTEGPYQQEQGQEKEKEKEKEKEQVEELVEELDMYSLKAQTLLDKYLK
jgi:hypothetical protein